MIHIFLFGMIIVILQTLNINSFTNLLWLNLSTMPLTFMMHVPIIFHTTNIFTMTMAIPQFLITSHPSLILLHNPLFYYIIHYKSFLEFTHQKFIFFIKLNKQHTTSPKSQTKVLFECLNSILIYCFHLVTIACTFVSLPSHNFILDIH
jgi:hypothetical protein